MQGSYSLPLAPHMQEVELTYCQIHLCSPVQDRSWGEGIGVFILAAPTCSRGANTDQRNTVYWLQSTQWSYFKIEEERKRHHEHCQRKCSREVIARFGWAEKHTGKAHSNVRTWRGYVTRQGRSLMHSADGGSQCKKALLWTGLFYHDYVKSELGRCEHTCPRVRITELRVGVCVVVRWRSSR